MWKLTEQKDSNSIVLEHEAILREYGYYIRKDITLNDDELLVKTTLTNLGRVPFATAWYSHHFFTCDSQSVKEGYSVDLDTNINYLEPGTWSWSTPLRKYAKVFLNREASVEMLREVGQNVKIKAEFVKDVKSDGGFTLRACGNSIRETIPEISNDGGVSMYAYNLYIETGTFSPEPQIFIRLQSGQSTSWTQRLEFSDDTSMPKASLALSRLTAITFPFEASQNVNVSFILIALTAVAFVSLSVHWTWKRRNDSYSPIPDV